jgi:hypothetical protein
VNAAINLSKVISKLSPIVGNLIEFNAVEYLNDLESFVDIQGEWIRQDPGFPDALFNGPVDPKPGFEIKAWFPLATEITARFKDSQNHFSHDQTYVCMPAWLPEHIIYGKPRIIDVGIFSGRSVAEARDNHYHKPPDYVVLEPEDTSARTSNLQQTNTNGYKFQGGREQFVEAEKLVARWSTKAYQPSRDYQHQLRELIRTYTYRLDTNFAKMDRIAHTGIEEFKTRVLETKVHGRAIVDWARLFSNPDPTELAAVIERELGIRDEDSEHLVQ